MKEETAIWKQTVATMSQEIIDLKAMVARFECKTVELQETVSAYEQENKSLSAELLKQDQFLDASDREIEGLKAQLSDAKQIVKGHESDAAGMVEEILQLRNDAKVRNLRNVTITGELVRARQEVQALKEDFQIRKLRIRNALA